MFIMLRKIAFMTNNASRGLENVDVFILCGGEGKRLRQAVSGKPKVLAEVNGKPFLEILIENIISYGFNRIILGVGYLKEQIINHFRNYGADNPGVKIEFSEEDSPLGTGGAVKKAAPLIESEHFLVMNGDAFFDLDLRTFYDAHAKNNAMLSVALTKVDDVSDCGSVALKDGRIIAFKEKVPAKKSSLVNAGIYLMKKEIFDYMPPEDSFSLEYRLFPEIINSHYCHGFIGNGKFIDIGVPKRYEKAKRLFASDDKA